MWKDAPFYFRAAIKLLLLTLVVYVAIKARQFLIPFTISLFFTFLLLPLTQTMESWKIPRAMASVLSILVATLVFGGLIYFLVMQVDTFVTEWPELKKQVTEKWSGVQQYIYNEFHISRRAQSRWVNHKIDETVAEGDLYALGIFNATGVFLAGLVLVPIYIFFLTCYRDKFKIFLSLVASNGNHEHMLEMLRNISAISQKYIKGILYDVLILSVLNSTGFLLLGLEHAILFGVLASILNIIPYVGVLIGSILPVLMALLSADSISVAIGVAFVCWFVQLLDNNFITPYVVGSSVSINPFAAFVALIIGALVWGVPGMVLCIPLTGMLKVVCDHVDALKPYGFVLGEEKRYEEKRQRNRRAWNRLKAGRRTAAENKS